MATKHGNKCDVFLEPIVKLAIVFGTVPNYDLEKKKFINRKLHKLWIMFLIGITAGTMVIFSYSKNEETLPVLKIINLLLGATELTTFVCTALGTLLWNTKNWEELIHRLSLLKFFNNSWKFSSSYWLFAIFIVKIIYLTAYMIYPFLVFDDFRRYYFVVIVFHLSRHILMYLTMWIVLFIRNSYKNINSMLLNVNVSSVVGNSTRNVPRQILTIYTETNRTVEAFNKFFGWQLLLYFAQSILYLLHCLALLTEIKFLMHETQFAGDSIIIMVVPNAILEECGIIMLVFFCDMAMRESDKLSANCSKVEEAMPSFSEEKEELQKLRDAIESRRVRFTAADFFEIKRSTILAMLATTTTYMIVVLQFNAS